MELRRNLDFYERGSCFVKPGVYHLTRPDGAEVWGHLCVEKIVLYRVMKQFIWESLVTMFRNTTTPWPTVLRVRIQFLCFISTLCSVHITHITQLFFGKLAGSIEWNVCHHDNPHHWSQGVHSNRIHPRDTFQLNDTRHRFAYYVTVVPSHKFIRPQTRGNALDYTRKLRIQNTEVHRRTPFARGLCKLSRSARQLQVSPLVACGKVFHQPADGRGFSVATA